MHSLLAQPPLILEAYTILSPVFLMFPYFVEPPVSSEFPVRDYFQICTFVKSPWVCEGSSQALASKPRCRSRHAHKICVRCVCRMTCLSLDHQTDPTDPDKTYIGP